MKQLTSISITLLTLLIFASAGFAQQTKVEQAEYQQKAQRVIQDTTLRILVIEQMAADPELRSEVIEQVTESMQEEKGTAMKPGMGAMMQDPAVKAHMQEHMKLMQAMKQGQKQMDPKMMQNPEMQRKMMETHLRCMEMMQDTTMMQQHKQMKQGQH